MNQKILTLAITTSVIIILFLSACSEEPYHPYEIIISDTPANLKGLNSIYDDYNAILLPEPQRLDIYFSSNRNSKGQDFDINAQCIDISYDLEEHYFLKIEISNDYPQYSFNLLPVINTDNNEYGPYIYPKGNNKFIFMYATEENGVFNIKYVYGNISHLAHYDSDETIYGPSNVTILNSEKDDLYPSINPNNNEIYFCSNRENNNFNIYKARIPLVYDITSVFEDTVNVEIEKESSLSGSYDDKCPFLNKNLLVFTSNREGGYGGFDLWYSQLVDNSWTEPVNFGSKINSEYDEYRPITFQYDYFNLMIFSSNRQGGKGGFDLYCVKIEELIE